MKKRIRENIKHADSLWYKRGRGLRCPFCDEKSAYGGRVWFKSPSDAVMGNAWCPLHGYVLRGP